MRKKMVFELEQAQLGDNQDFKTRDLNVNVDLSPQSEATKTS